MLKQRSKTKPNISVSSVDESEEVQSCENEEVKDLNNDTQKSPEPEELYVGFKPKKKSSKLLKKWQSAVQNVFCQIEEEDYEESPNPVQTRNFGVK